MSRATAPGARTRTILIVDDMPANLGVLVDSLECIGHRVLVARGGEEALKRASFTRPDLILLDVVMPGIDGFETCRRLKAAESTRDIPVLFMTCLTGAADKLVGFKAGGVDYITKPFETGEVIARVTTHLSLREAQKELVPQRAARASPLANLCPLLDPMRAAPSFLGLFVPRASPIASPRSWPAPFCLS